MTKTQLKRHPDVNAKILPDGYVLLHVKYINWVYTLTPLAGLVWEFCDGLNTVEEVVHRISEMKEVIADPQLPGQVAEFMAELEKAGLLIDKDITDIPALTADLRIDCDQAMPGRSENVR